jgi:hypothetical protein
MENLALGRPPNFRVSDVIQVAGVRCQVSGKRKIEAET